VRIDPAGGSVGKGSVGADLIPQTHKPVGVLPEPVFDALQVGGSEVLDDLFDVVINLRRRGRVVEELHLT
jgi:hypothetical protein